MVRALWIEVVFLYMAIQGALATMGPGGVLERLRSHGNGIRVGYSTFGIFRAWADCRPPMFLQLDWLCRCPSSRAPTIRCTLVAAHENNSRDHRHGVHIQDRDCQPFLLREQESIRNFHLTHQLEWVCRLGRFAPALRAPIVICGALRHHR